ncbi:MAG: DNA-3-methyladenine glycosylase I [Clostridia bacterium]|nr:DNA-3-methyladenine glycosylase I [Clostridia bacterium]
MYKCAWCRDGGVNEAYHDAEWGIPLHDDRRHFEYLMMEVMQCGLNWTMMLKKREIFRQCFDGFDFNAIANYGEADVERILSTEGMIRSPRKVNAVIGNARCFIGIIGEFGSFDRYLWAFTDGQTHVYRRHHRGQWEASNALSDAVSADLKKRGFKYLGSVTVFSHLQACGMINDHEPDCFLYERLMAMGNVRFIDD